MEKLEIEVNFKQIPTKLFNQKTMKISYYTTLFYLFVLSDGFYFFAAAQKSKQKKLPKFSGQAVADNKKLKNHPLH